MKYEYYYSELQQIIKAESDEYRLAEKKLEKSDLNIENYDLRGTVIRNIIIDERYLDFYINERLFYHKSINDDDDYKVQIKDIVFFNEFSKKRHDFLIKNKKPKVYNNECTKFKFPNDKSVFE